MKLARRHPPQRGFTLVEILVALAILGMIISAIYATWILILRSSAMAQFVAARAQRERIAVRTVEDALICSESFQASMKYYSFIVINGEEPVLSFTARVPEVFPRNGEFGDINLRRLNFTLEQGTGEEHGKNLVLRQNPILMDMKEDEKKFPLVLARGVKTFGIDCWDTNKLDWVEQWDNTNAIPPVVRIRLQLDGDANSADATALTVVRLVAMPCEMMPANIQQPTGGGGFPGGPGGQNGLGNPGNPGNQGGGGGRGGLPPLNPGGGRGNR